MMSGLLVWAHSYCRSSLAFYEGLARAFGVPLRVLVWIRGTSNRRAVGFNNDEFAHLDVRFIGDDEEAAKAELDSHRDWHHLFGTYQKGDLFRRMLLEARRQGCRVAIASEAPCIMVPGFRGLLKSAYIRTYVRLHVRKQIALADYILNFSGDVDSSLRRIGWPRDQIVPCGYYSPPLVDSRFCARDDSHRSPFTVLMTGKPEWHRNPMLLLQAMTRLKQEGHEIRAIITQNGPLLEGMKAFARAHGLDVEFAGLVPYPRLVELYQSCSCFVATGRAEPWGIRVNDALHCGAPLVVSEGMGAVKLIRDHRCGLSFRNGNAEELADKLRELATDRTLYRDIAGRVADASKRCLPGAMAETIRNEITVRFTAWRP